MIPENTIGNFSIRDEVGYVSLYKGKQHWTDDAPQSNQLQQVWLDKCWGKVLVGGLGTGYAARYLAQKQNVTEIIVVEIAQEVIDLVWPYIDTQGKGKIVCADIFEFLKKPIKIDTAYFDIYNNLGRKSVKEGNAKLKKLAEQWTQKIYFWRYK